MMKEDKTAHQTVTLGLLVSYKLQGIFSPRVYRQLWLFTTPCSWKWHNLRKTDCSKCSCHRSDSILPGNYRPIVASIYRLINANFGVCNNGTVKSSTAGTYFVESCAKQQHASLLISLDSDLLLPTIVHFPQRIQNDVCLSDVHI